jgi:hypothetical protein
MTAFNNMMVMMGSLASRALPAALLLLASWAIRCDAVNCNNYRAACFAEIGSYVTQNGNADIPLLANAAFYFSFDVSVCIQSCCFWSLSFQVVRFRMVVFERSSWIHIWILLQMPASASDIGISSTVFYGEVAYYFAVGREPKTSDFDFVADSEGTQSVIPKVVTSMSFKFALF